MSTSDSTCWTVIAAAAAGSAGDREAFARSYRPVARAYLAARWRSSPCLQDVDDAVQEVFVECFKAGGVLARAERGRGFRPFLYGVMRHVARRFEADRGRQREQSLPGDADLDGLAGPDESLSVEFDRAWAKALVREAGRQMEVRAGADGAAWRRVELLRLRFHDGLAIRDIAARWHIDAATLHHEYARARREFKAALLEVVAFHLAGSPAQVEQECADLLALLG